MNKNIIEKIPTAWKDVKVKDFEKLTELTIVEPDGKYNNLFVGIDNSVNVLSVFTGISAKELNSIPINEVIPLMNRLEFMKEMPQVNKKSKIKWKNVDEITYGDYILYQQFGNEDFFKNLHLLIPAFSKEKILEEDVLNMNLEDMHTAFFFLRKDVTKYQKHIQNYLKMKKWMGQIKRLFKRK